MSHGEVLIELARQVRGDTLQVLDAAQADWLTWSPKGTSNHITDNKAEEERAASIVKLDATKSEDYMFYAPGEEHTEGIGS